MKNKGIASIAVVALGAFFLSIGLANAHLLWIETEHKPAAPEKQEIKIFFGHPDMPETNIVVEIVDPVVHKPDGSIIGLDLKKEADHWKSYIILDQKGDYIVTASRKPGIFDPKWHDMTGPVELFRDHAKVIIHSGLKKKWDKAVGQELEIVPLVNPYNLHVGDTFKARLLYNGKAVKGEYSAAHATQNIHTSEEAQVGKTLEDGTFSVIIDKPGMWIVLAEYSVNKSGTWTATHDLVYKNRTYYSKGEKLHYDRVRCRSTITIWASSRSE